MAENGRIGRCQRGDTGYLIPPKNQKSIGVEGKRHDLGWEDSKLSQQTLSKLSQFHMESKIQAFMGGVKNWGYRATCLGGTKDVER